MKIRKMKHADIEQIMKLEKEIFSNPWTKGMFTEEIDSQYAYLIKSDKDIFGYICGWKLLNEMNITNLAVAETIRGKGFGTKLLKHLLKQCKTEDITGIFLEVRLSNTHTIEFYRKFGFEIIGIRKNYYSNPKEDALLMRKNLKET